jgi:hypothetical protein
VAPAPCLPPVFFHFNPPPEIEHLNSIPLASYATALRELQTPKFTTGVSFVDANDGATIKDTAITIVLIIAIRELRFMKNLSKVLEDDVCRGRT